MVVAQSIESLFSAISLMGTRRDLPILNLQRKNLSRQLWLWMSHCSVAVKLRLAFSVCLWCFHFHEDTLGLVAATFQ